MFPLVRFPPVASAEERHRQERAVVEALFRRYEGVIAHPTIRWYSLDPDTGEWHNDRMYRRRFKILDDLLLERQETEWRSWRVVQSLESDSGRYGFLARNVHRFRSLPIPEGVRLL